MTHSHHFHSLVVTGLDQPELKVYPSRPIHVMLTAHAMTTDLIKELRAGIPEPEIVEACDAWLALPPGVGGIKIGPAAFAVTTCCENAGECRPQLDFVVDSIVAEFTAKHALLATLVVPDSPEPGFYL